MSLAIAEADVLGSAGLYLNGTGGGNRTLRAVFTAYLDRGGLNESGPSL
jgi:hypothetical protein